MDDTFTLLKPHEVPLAGALSVRRLLPAAAARSIGPFVFFDHFGPVTLGPQDGADVGPHPHIGLATVTYLFEGAQIHRDSLGTVQAIEAGAVNWMSAGRGIVHSERARPEDAGRSRALHGLQLWSALPSDDEEGAPSFQHVAAQAIPSTEQGGALVRVLVGSAFGWASPVRAALPTLYLDVVLKAGQSWSLPALAEELGVYAVTGRLSLDGIALPPYHLARLAPQRGASLQAEGDVRLVVIGGTRLQVPRAMWWNFVASDRARIADAARRWESGGFATIPNETAGIRMPPYKA